MKLTFKHIIATIVVILLLAVGGVSWSQSERPSPLHHEGVQPLQAQSAKPIQQSPTDQRGTEQAPVIVKVLPPEDEKKRADTEAKREEQKTANDERLATFSERLFYATVALSIIAVFQFFAFTWQGVHLRRTVAITRRQTDATINAKSPRLLFLGSKFVRYESADGPPIEDPISGSPYGFIRPILLIKNGGRTLLTMKSNMR